jgi:phosphate-selective porin OprO and OprP
MYGRPIILVTAAAALAGAAENAFAQDAQELQNLRRQVEQQQRQIEELSRKLDQLQGQAQKATEKADVAAQTTQKAEEKTPDLNVAWAPGPIFSSKDGSWSVHVLGLLQVDGGALGDNDNFYKNDNATELRRARLGIEGKFYQGWAYKFEPDFANDSVDFKDAYIQYNGHPVEPFYIRVGQYKTQNSLDNLTSDLYITFMERSAIVDAFDLDYQIGLSSGTSGENWGVDGGLFGQNTSDQDNNEGYALAGRGHYAFLYGSTASDHAVHLGASVRYRNFDNGAFDNSVQYRQRPFFHFTNTRSVDTRTVTDVAGDVWTGAEFAWVNGPFSIQSEVANTAAQGKNGQDDVNNLWGGYFGGGYFLTGEHRPYEPKQGVFGRVKVDRPLQKGGPGAWEVGARADYIDLNDKEFKGGEQVSYIAGVSWYPNDYIRFILDGAITQVFQAGNSDAAVDGSDNLIYGGGIRAQVDW